MAVLTKPLIVRRSRVLSSKQLRARQRLIRSLTAVAIFFGLWQALTMVGILNALFVSSPVGIVGALGTLLGRGELLPDLKASGVEFGLGFGLGAVAGVVLGTLIGWIRFLDDVADAFIAGFYATPYIAFLPIIILWLGVGLGSKVGIIFWASFFPIVINTIAGVKNTPAEFLRVSRAFCVGRLRTLTTVVVPAAIPYILAGLRQGVGRGLVGVIVAEFYISDKGVGFFIGKTTAAFRTNQAFATILLVGAVGVVLVRAVAELERRFGQWRAAT